MSIWKNILGFVPEKELGLQKVDKKCQNCNSKKVKRLNSQAWTDKFKCNECGYFTYVVYSDRMSGATTDNVAIDKKESKII